MLNAFLHLSLINTISFTVCTHIFLFYAFGIKVNYSTQKDIFPGKILDILLLLVISILYVLRFLPSLSQVCSCNREGCRSAVTQ